MFSIIQKGGPIMYPIVLLSILVIVIVVERFIYFRKIKKNEEQMLARLKDVMKKGHFDEAAGICETNPSPVTNLIKVGIENRHKSREEMKDIIVSAANLEVPKIERFIGSLGTIANIATLLGLLGTVLGNIQCFDVLGNAGAAASPAELAKGIAQALITTAAGLFVAIPTLVFYNYFVHKSNVIITELENKVANLITFVGGSR